MTFFENELVVCIKQPKSYTEKYLEMIELYTCNIWLEKSI
jgi:hypothetical protein